MKLITVKPKLFYSWQAHVWKNLTFRNVFVAARQHGKTYFITELIRSFVYAPNIPQPEIIMCLPTIGDAFKLYKTEFDAAFGHNSSYKYPDNDCKHIALLRSDNNYANIHIIGTLMNPFGPKGTSPHLIVMDEAASNHPRTFLEACCPATDKSGGIIVVTGTVEDNWFRKLYRKAERKVAKGSKNWSHFIVRLGDKWSVQVHSAKRRYEIMDSYDMDDPEEKLIFEKEMLCNWRAASVGKIYSNDVDSIYASDRITNVLPLGDHKIGIAWDNGLTTGIWFFQYVNEVIRMLKYEEWRQESYHKICSDIVAYCKKNELTLGLQIMPFTMSERSQRFKHLPTVCRTVNELMGYKGPCIINPKIGLKTSKIKSMHKFLKHCVFDTDGCEQGLEKVSNYKIEGAKQKEKALNDHATDALSELAVVFCANILKEYDLKIKEALTPMDDYDNIFNIKQNKYKILGPY